MKLLLTQPTQVHKGACLKFSQLKIQVKSTSNTTDPDFSQAFIHTTAEIWRQGLPMEIPSPDS